MPKVPEIQNPFAARAASLILGTPRRCSASRNARSDGSSHALIWRAPEIAQGMINVARVERRILRHDAVRALPKRFVRRELFALGRGQTRGGPLAGSIALAAELGSRVLAHRRSELKRRPWIIAARRRCAGGFSRFRNTRYTPPASTPGLRCAIWWARCQRFSSSTSQARCSGVSDSNVDTPRLYHGLGSSHLCRVLRLNWVKTAVLLGLDCRGGEVGAWVMRAGAGLWTRASGGLGSWECCSRFLASVPVGGPNSERHARVQPPPFPFARHPTGRGLCRDHLQRRAAHRVYQRRVPPHVVAVCDRGVCDR
jgi:hypothetical protein